MPTAADRRRDHQEGAEKAAGWCQDGLPEEPRSRLRAKEVRSDTLVTGVPRESRGAGGWKKPGGTGCRGSPHSA